MAATIATVLLALISLPGKAYAQWSITGFLGNASTTPARLEIKSAATDTSVTIEDVHLKDESSQSPWYYGGRITRTLGRVPWLGFEAEFIHAKTIAETSQFVRVRGRANGTALDGELPLGAVLPRFELSHGLNFLLGNAVVQWPPASNGRTPRATIAGRLGIGPTIPHVESTFQGTTQDGYQLGRIAIAGAVGAELRLSRHLAGVGEFKWTTTRERVDVGPAKIEGTFTTRHLVAGVVWKISAPRSSTVRTCDCADARRQPASTSF